MAPFNTEDMLSGKTKNIRLYVKRVFISDEFDGELVRHRHLFNQYKFSMSMHLVTVDVNVLALPPTILVSFLIAKSFLDVLSLSMVIFVHEESYLRIISYSVIRICMAVSSLLGLCQGCGGLQ
jgi:hypothetical protein